MIDNAYAKDVTRWSSAPVFSCFQGNHDTARYLVRRSDPRRFDKPFRGLVDGPAFAAARRVDVERLRSRSVLADAARRQRDLVGDWRGMVSEEQLGPVDEVQRKQALDEIGPDARQQQSDDAAGLP